MRDDPKEPVELAHGRTILGQPVSRLVAIAGAVVVTAIVASTAMLVPTLARVDRTLGLLEESLPVLQAVEPEVGRIADDVDHLTPKIDEMETGLGGIEGGVEQLDGRFSDVSDPLTRLELRIGELTERLDTLDELPVMRQGLDDTNATLGEVRGDLAGLGSTLTEVRDEFRATRGGLDDMAGSLQVLVEDFDRVVSLLEETVTYIERLDRKTGPALLPPLDR